MTNDCRIANKKVELQLWDMAGQEDYPALRKLSYHGANVFVLCFNADIPTENSFQSFTRKWIIEMAKECPNVPIILVGTRNPHGERDDDEGGGRAASRGIQVRKLRAGNLGTFKYIYCDPKSGEGVDYAFHCVRLSCPMIIRLDSLADCCRLSRRSLTGAESRYDQGEDEFRRCLGEG